MGYSFLQLSPKEEFEVRSCLAVIETEERKREFERKEKDLQEKEEKLKQRKERENSKGKKRTCKKRKKLKQKAREIRSATIEAKRVAAWLQLMVGQLGNLANHILAEAKNRKI